MLIYIVQCINYSTVAYLAFSQYVVLPPEAVIYFNDNMSTRKKVDNRIRVLIENGIALRHRTMFVIVGDKGKDQVNFEVACRLSEFLRIF